LNISEDWRAAAVPAGIPGGGSPVGRTAVREDFTAMPAPEKSPCGMDFFSCGMDFFPRQIFFISHGEILKTAEGGERMFGDKDCTPRGRERVLGGESGTFGENQKRAGCPADGRHPREGIRESLKTAGALTSEGGSTILFPFLRLKSVRAVCYTILI
jgi:hypothetical protein